MLYDKERKTKNKMKKINDIKIDTESRLKDDMMDSKGFVKVIQPGPYYGKIGIILKHLESSDNLNWYLVDVEGQKVGLEGKMLERG